MKKTTEKILEEIEVHKEHIKTLNAQMRPILSQLRPIEKKIEEHSSAIDKLTKRLDVIELDIKKNQNDWDYWLFEDGHVEQDRYDLRSKKIAEIGVGHLGFHQSTKQVQIDITLIKGDPKSLAKTEKGLKTLLPYIKPINDCKIISIFEHTLSKYGFYELLIKDGEFKLRKTAYHRPEILKTFKSLRNALLYIQEHHYYQRMDGNDEGDNKT